MRSVLLPGLVLAAVATAGAVHGQRGQPPAGVPGGLLASSPGAAAVRRILVQALGRSADPNTLDPLIGHLDDLDLTVRREAAFALAQRFFHTPAGPESAAARTGIMVRLTRDTGDGDDVRTLLRALGELPLEDTAFAAVEKYLVEQTLPSNPPHPTRRLGALEGLEALIRLNRSRDPAAETILRLRQLAVPGVGLMSVEEPLLPAMQALHSANDRDPRTVLAAARYRCRAGASLGCGWEFRRLAAQLMDSTDTQYSDALSRLLDDPAFQVRIDALRTVAAGLDAAPDCGPIVHALDDSMSVVAFEATKLLDKRCEDAKTIGEMLELVANDLVAPMKVDAWMMPMHALEALARVSPERARALMREMAVTHKESAVRATAARMSGVLRDAETAVQLTADDEPKVRTDALLALKKLDSSLLPQKAREELARLRPSPLSTARLPDVGSLWTALTALKGQTQLTDVPALSDVLSLPETSRMARLAALDRLMEMAPPNAAGNSPLRSDLAMFQFYLREPFPADPPVALMCAKIIEVITGLRPDLPSAPPQTRWPPTGTGRPLVTLEGGDLIVLELYGAEAPETVARFNRRITDRDDGFAGLLFHRLLPNVLIQGGARGGSDWMATPCDASRPAPRGAMAVLGRRCEFWSDEFNPARHERGAVALATNGPGTGIGQFFIDLVDTPAFDHEYTVFGRVICAKPARPGVYVTGHPMDVVDRIAEGDRILHIRYPPQPLDLSAFKCVSGVQ